MLLGLITVKSEIDKDFYWRYTVPVSLVGQCTKTIWNEYAVKTPSSGKGFNAAVGQSIPSTQFGLRCNTVTGRASLKTEERTGLRRCV